jgi:hypothetical protein
MKMLNLRQPKCGFDSRCPLSSIVDLGGVIAGRHCGIFIRRMQSVLHRREEAQSPAANG